FFQAEDGIRDDLVTGVQTCALPIFPNNTGTSAACARHLPSAFSSRYKRPCTEFQSGARATMSWAQSSGSAAAWALLATNNAISRSEERRVGKESRHRWAVEQSAVSE